MPPCIFSATLWGGGPLGFSAIGLLDWALASFFSNLPKWHLSYIIYCFLVVYLSNSAVLTLVAILSPSSGNTSVALGNESLTHVKKRCYWAVDLRLKAIYKFQSSAFSYCHIVFITSSLKKISSECTWNLDAITFLIVFYCIESTSILYRSLWLEIGS